jgi:hypothetical protein
MVNSVIRIMRKREKMKISDGITVKEFKYIPGKNDAEYIKKLEERRKIDKRIINTAIAKIKSLSAGQSRQTGEWVYGEDDCGQDGWFCSKCRFFVPWYYKYYYNSDFIRDYKTCPCCDAKMVSYTGKKGE